MSVRNIDKGFVYAPTDVQIPYTGAVSGTLDVYYLVMGNVVILNLPRITFTVQAIDQLYFKLPPDCCLPSSTRTLLTYSFHTYGNNNPNGGGLTINIATGDVTIYGNTLFQPFTPIGMAFDIYDQQITYILA